MADKSSAWRPGPTVCRCCLAEGCYKDISTEYFWMGKREVYADMLADTLSLSIGYSKTGGPNSNSRLICEPCISRLRDATDFKRQVQECEKTFMQYLDPGSSSVMSLMDSDDIQMETIEKDVKIEQVKVEKKYSDDEFDSRDFGDDDDDDDDMDQPLTTFASKEPKKETINLLDLLESPKKKTTKPKLVAKKKIIIKKDVKVKPTTSKAVPKSDDKKRKGNSDTENDLEEIEKQNHITRRLNACTIVENTTVCPFRWSKNHYLCFYCDLNFPDLATLKKHNDGQHEKTNSIPILRGLKKMKKTDFVKIDFSNAVCRICGRTLDNIAETKRHLVEEHGKKINFECGDGVLPFKLMSGNFNCAICRVDCEEFKTLNQHMNIHYPHYICEQCGSGFMTPQRLKNHGHTHISGSHPCEICHKKFRSKNAKNDHYAIVHLKAKRHRCPHCFELFSNYFQRNKHLSSVHGQKLKEFKCSVCSRVFQASGKLGVHMKTVHLKLKRFACDVCEWQFYSKSELKEHMVKHTGKRAFQCTICKKFYARKYTLTEHMRIHDNDRRFVCAVCGSSFVQKCSLKHHTKTHHPNSITQISKDNEYLNNENCV